MNLKSQNPLFNLNLETRLYKSNAPFSNWGLQMENLVNLNKAILSDIGTLGAAIDAIQIIIQSTLNVRLILMGGTAITVTINQVNAGNVVLGLTDSSSPSGGTVVTLPDATKVIPGSPIRFSMAGGNILSIKNSVAGQKLDGNDIDTAQKIRRPSSSVMSGFIIPLQTFCIYAAADNSGNYNWHSITND